MVCAKCEYFDECLHKGNLLRVEKLEGVMFIPEASDSCIKRKNSERSNEQRIYELEKAINSLSKQVAYLNNKVKSIPNYFDYVDK